MESSSQRLIEIIKLHLNSTSNRIPGENERLLKNFKAFLSSASLDSNKQTILRCLNCNLDLVPGSQGTTHSRETGKKTPNATATEILEINTKNSTNSVLTKSLNFIILIPLMLYVETTHVKNESLFQRKQNTILNMKDARNYHNFNKKNSLNT